MVTVLINFGLRCATKVIFCLLALISKLTWTLLLQIFGQKTGFSPDEIRGRGVQFFKLRPKNSSIYFFISPNYLHYFKLSDCGKKTHQEPREISLRSSISSTFPSLNNCHCEALDPKRLEESSSEVRSQTVIVLGSSQV